GRRKATAIRHGDTATQGHKRRRPAVRLPSGMFSLQAGNATQPSLTDAYLEDLRSVDRAHSLECRASIAHYYGVQILYDYRSPLLGAPAYRSRRNGIHWSRLRS